MWWACISMASGVHCKKFVHSALFLERRAASAEPNEPDHSMGMTKRNISGLQTPRRRCGRRRGIMLVRVLGDVGKRFFRASRRARRAWDYRDGARPRRGFWSAGGGSTSSSRDFGLRGQQSGAGAGLSARRWRALAQDASRRRPGEGIPAVRRKAIASTRGGGGAYSRSPVPTVSSISPGWKRGWADLGGGPVLVSIQLANNETGAIQPVAEAASLVRAAGGLYALRRSGRRRARSGSISMRSALTP